VKEAMPKVDTDAIEEGIKEALRPPVQLHPVPATAEETPMRQAMRNVDRHVDKENLQIEAFIDEAVHLRIAMMRGAYVPGPRDTWVRKMMLDAVMSISAVNAGDLGS
jgi:hypothetical protein